MTEEQTEAQIAYIDDICRKIRCTLAEFGESTLDDATIVGVNIGKSSISGIPYINCQTLASPTLGNTDFKIARFFEDV